MHNNHLQSKARSFAMCATAAALMSSISSPATVFAQDDRHVSVDQTSASQDVNAGSGADTAASSKNTQATRDAEKVKHHVPDFSAKKRLGKASFYANDFAGKKMADGAVMDPHGDNAASKTLPLGTTAKVTNLETGKSAVVTIQDRGPYVPGRIVDLSPETAKEIGISHKKGVALVVVAPIAVPQPDGGVKLGTAAHEPVEKTTVTKEIRDVSLDTRVVQR
jgi:rare lipoprotein A